MKLHILFSVSDRLRRAINFHHGKSGQATRQEVRGWLWQHGHSKDEELLRALFESEEKKDDVQR